MAVQLFAIIRTSRITVYKSVTSFLSVNKSQGTLESSFKMWSLPKEKGKGKAQI